MSTTELYGMRPRDLVDWKYDQMIWWDSPIGVKYAAGYERDKASKYGPGGKNALPGTVSYTGMGPQMSQIWVQAFAQGDPYFVTEEMSQLCMNAAETMPETKIDMLALPTDHGVIYIEGGIPIVDHNSIPYMIEVIVWSKVKIAEPDGRWGLCVGQFNRTPPEMRGHFPPLTLMHWATYTEGLSPEETIYGSPNVQADITATEAALTELSLMKWLQACLVIMDQHIAVSYRETPDRAQKRRWGRRNIVPEDTIVVTLRRAEKAHLDNDENDTPVEWSHRWWVNGHWRRIETKDGPKLTWVRGHIKGPDHLPLVVKHRVNLFRR